MKIEGVNLRSITPMLWYAGASVLLFYSGLFAFLFAVPIQMAYTRRGREKGMSAAVLTALLVVAIHLLQSFRFKGVEIDAIKILFLDSLMPIGVLAGLSVFNLARRYDWWLRLIMAAGVAVLGAIPSLHLLRQAVMGEGEMAQQLTSMLAVLGVDNNAQQWIELVQRVVFDSIGVGLMVAVAANWWIGRNFAWRGAASISILRFARVPDQMVWAVISGLAVVVLAWLRSVPFWLEVAGWNALLVGSFLFAVQGVGLLQHLLVLRGVGPVGERWVLTGTLILLFIPGLNVVVSIGLPLFGMSELWIDYRRGESYESNSE